MKQINLTITLEQYEKLKKIAAAAAYPTRVAHVARKLLQDAIDAL